MSNKNISNFSLNNATTGDFLLYWSASSNTTRKAKINQLVALSPESASAIATTGTVSGAKNVGNGQGGVFLRNASGVLEFKTLKQGSNVTINDDGTGMVTINAADPPSVPIQSVQNTGVGAGVFSGIQGTTVVLKSITGASGVSVTNNAQNIVINGPSGINVSSGVGTIFHSIVTNGLQFKTIEAGTGISIVNKTGTVQINFSGLFYGASYGSGNSHDLSYGGNPAVWNTVKFSGATVSINMGSPFLNIPGNGIYMLDLIMGFVKGSSVGDDIWVRFYNSGTAQPILNSTNMYVVGGNSSTSFYDQLNIKVIANISSATTITVQSFFSGDVMGAHRLPYIVSTGTTFSYLKIA